MLLKLQAIHPLSIMASTMHMSAPAQCRCGTAPRAAQAAKVLHCPLLSSVSKMVHRR